MNMVVRMISGNITIPTPHPMPLPSHEVEGDEIFPEVIVATIFILNSLRELKITCFVDP